MKRKPAKKSTSSSSDKSVPVYQEAYLGKGKAGKKSIRPREWGGTHWDSGGKKTKVVSERISKSEAQKLAKKAGVKGMVTGITKPYRKDAALSIRTAPKTQTKKKGTMRGKARPK